MTTGSSTVTGLVALLLAVTLLAPMRSRRWQAFSEAGWHYFQHELRRSLRPWGIAFLAVGVVNIVAATDSCALLVVTLAGIVAGPTIGFVATLLRPAVKSTLEAEWKQGEREDRIPAAIQCNERTKVLLSVWALVVGCGFVAAIGILPLIDYTYSLGHGVASALKVILGAGALYLGVIAGSKLAVRCFTPSELTRALTPDPLTGDDERFMRFLIDRALRQKHGAEATTPR